MTFFRKSAFFAAGLMASIAFTAPAFAGKADDTLNVAMAEEILNLDYNYTTKREYIILAQLTDSTLFDLDPATQAFKPAVATGYDFIDDTTVDITLRDDVRFHDGSTLTAEDVAYTYNWIINPESESNASGTIGRWLDNAEVTGPNTVRFHLKSVYPLVLRDMAQRIMLRKAGTYDEGGVIDRDAMASDLIGTGPYKVVSFEPGQELVLERFDDYFGEKPAIEKIVVRSLPDMGTQQAELMSGGVDWMFKVPLELAENLGSTPMAEHLSGPDLRIGFLVLDAGGLTDPDGPLTKPKVRQAINHALNKSDMAKYLIGGSAEAIHTACHPAQFGCDQNVTDYPYDPEKAKELLAEAGYPDGFPLEIWAYRDKPAAEAIAADLEAIGIDVDLRYVKLASLNQARADQNIPAYFGTWGSGGTADTAAIARIHFSMDTDRNLSGDEALAETVLAAEQTVDQEKRKELYSEALGKIADEAYWAPLFTYSANYLVSPDLEFPLDPDGLPRLQNSSWK
ncbi:ABC transporter substrate-binding protein [Martelella lutilitoris]|uniref:ABC transporter substrate-binding protein n=1 Tax=Martelella lutilitoris TaxID=2583532 RepID=A0A5C4JQ35_9HYPH|nr:ABC transporter substrate-binding protein [Martelella lutilitoris]TNB47595.1 ABC transporter substrate-binding protein [Martelella lutilitoris]